MMFSGMLVGREPSFESFPYLFVLQLPVDCIKVSRALVTHGLFKSEIAYNFNDRHYMMNVDDLL